MNKSIALTKPVFEKLIEHLIFVEEAADRMADFYFPDSPEDRKDMRHFFSQYIKKIEEEMKHITVVRSFADVSSPDNLNAFPFVIIGSEVELEDISGSTVFVYRLIHPDRENKAKNGITYLSPLGKALLLKNTGSEIDMDASDAVRCVKIKVIRLLT